MELLDKVMSSNDFGLRKIFPWKNVNLETSDYMNTEISEVEKIYVKEHLRYIFEKNARLKIVRLEDPYLWGRYVLRYEEMKAHPKSEHVEEMIMIHSTSSSNACKIAETNFDWRLWKRDRFGRGVCFAKHAQYARQFASEKGTYIISGVLVANGKRGHKKQIYPKDGDDTTNGKIEKNVCIKYDDNDFYPYYIVSLA